MNLVLIALGGALGAVSRFLLGNAVSKAIGSALPYGTFVVNVIGCFAMGLLMTIIVDRELLPASWRLFLCVGFTFFSAFMSRMPGSISTCPTTFSSISLLM